MFLSTREWERHWLLTEELSNLTDASRGYRKEVWSSVRYICEAAFCFGTVSKVL